jgi:hypothetical protein
MGRCAAADRLDPVADGAQGSGQGIAAVYLPSDPASRTAYAAGEVAQCDLWFPDIILPVGFGRTRTAIRLPVLVTVTGYARWLVALTAVPGVLEVSRPRPPRPEIPNCACRRRRRACSRPRW